MNQDTPGCGTTQTMGHGEGATCGQSFYGSPWYCSACTMKAAIAAAVAAERERGRKATQEYMRANPLGGPAKVFYACADAIRAGDPIDQAMANFGLAWAAPDSAAIRGN